MQPESGVKAGLCGIARAVIGGVQVEQMAGEAAFIQAVDAADAIDRGDQAGIFRGPVGGVLGHDRLRAGPAAVAGHAGGKIGQDRLGGFRPVHGVADDDGAVVAVP